MKYEILLICMLNKAAIVPFSSINADFIPILGNDEECATFPLSKEVLDSEINVFHPIKCGQLKAFNEDTISSNPCFRDKTIIVIGDSRAKLLAGHFGVVLQDQKSFIVEKYSLSYGHQYNFTFFQYIYLFMQSKNVVILHFIFFQCKLFL